MRKLKLQVQISIDGFIAGPNGGMDWLEWNWSEDIKKYVEAITEPVDQIILGRKLAEGFIPTWEARAQEPGGAEEGAVKFNETPKVVFTKKMETTDWKNTELAHNLEQDIAKLKGSEGGDLIAYGGGTLVSSLIAAGLIDEFYLFVNPVALGKGMPIFEGLNTMQKLKLTEARQFDCGITLLYYTKI